MTFEVEWAMWGLWWPVFKCWDLVVTPVGFCIASFVFLYIAYRLPYWIEKIPFPGPCLIVYINNPHHIRRAEFDEYIKATENRIKKSHKSRHRTSFFMASQY
jgi:hypothetical protein